MPRRLTAAERASQRSGISLAGVPLVGAKTEKLEKRLWEGFLEWIAEDCKPDMVKLLTSAASTTSTLLQLYGEYLFEVGAPLSSFRHLVTFAQRLYPDFKLHSKPCWDHVTKWEIVEPLVHRVPLPERLCEAMAAVAFAWKWPRFGLVLLIAFYGILRIGEVVSAFRSSLVLPSDLLSDKLDKLFLRILQPKTARRGGGRQQHVTIVHGPLVRACEAIFKGAKSSEPLFPLSAQTFRRRWDQVLEALHVPRSAALTPASVRGGGAVASYQSGTPVHNLVWQMRVKHVHTLQHYLQEMAAENVLGHLPSDSKSAVRSASSCLTLFLDSL